MKDITGYEGLYAVTEDGKIWAYPRERSSSFGKWLKVCVNNAGYPYISLSKDKKHRSYTVHRLIATAYLPNPSNLPEVNHKNAVKTDNRLENLEWCTHAQNVAHAIELGLRTPACGEKIKIHKLNAAKIKEIRHLGKEGVTHRRIAKQFGIANSGVCAILRGRAWKHVA